LQHRQYETGNGQFWTFKNSRFYFVRFIKISFAVKSVKQEVMLFKTVDNVGHSKNKELKFIWQVQKKKYICVEVLCRQRQGKGGQKRLVKTP
jgi:hypothetical protein